MSHQTKDESANQLALFVSPPQPEAEVVIPSTRKRSINSNTIRWVDAGLLADHPLNIKLFGQERLANVDDLVLAMGSGYDAGRAIKCVQRQDGSLTIIDGHRRKRAAEVLNCQAAVIVQSVESEADELEEMILSNLVRNRSYNTCGIGTAVRLIQMVKPRNVKRGRPPKNQAQRASVSKQGESVNVKAAHPITGIDQVKSDGIESRRAYYASLLGISEKKFRLVDYVLAHGNSDEKRELDFGPRKLNAIYKAVRARVTGEEADNGQDARVIARTARGALRAAISLLSLLGAEGCSEEIERGIKGLAPLAKSEAAGAKPKGATAAYAMKLYRKLLNISLRGTKLAKE